ncbi:MAG TPA: GNAT family N-acetyltransferase [Actinomycetota bacterium]|nr:GNAT family N-acetyltransferase [Actinomycetota bacterium]
MPKDNRSSRAPSSRSSPDFEIRPVHPEEVARAGELTVSAYLNPPAIDDAPRDFGVYLDELRDVRSRAREAVVLVALSKGALSGSVTYVPTAGGRYAEFQDPAAAGIRMLAVAPEARGRGVGAALVRECLARARADERQRVILHTTHWMHAAHRLYEELGFSRRAELDMDLPEVYLVAYGLEL